MSTKVIILGCGTDASMLPGIPNRQPPGFLVDWGEEQLLFDCSEGIRFRLEKAGYDFTKIRNIAISHAHPDHYALPHFFQSVWNTRQWSKRRFDDFSMQVFAPKEICENFPALWRYYHTEMEQILPIPNFTFIPSQSGKEYILGKSKLSAEKVYHGWGKAECFAYRINTPDGVVVYSGDTGDCDGIRKIAKNADLFICESSAQISETKSPQEYGHLNPQTTGDIAAKSGVKKLVIVHYTGLDSDDEMKKEIKKSGFKGEIVIGQDEQTFMI